MFVRTISHNIIKFFFVSFGIILLSAFIGLFLGGTHVSFKQYISNVVNIIISLAKPAELTISNLPDRTYPMFPAFWDAYFYSIIIFISALFVSVIMGLLFAYCTYLLPSKVSKIMMRCFSLIESVPDLFVLIVIQYSLIAFYKRTGIMIFPVIGLNDHVYAAPIIVLSILPSILLFRIFFLLIQEEKDKMYVDLVRSKGLSKHYIFFIHILRNVPFSLVNHFKSVILFMLSSLIVFERLFNIYGITHFMLVFTDMYVISFSLIMFYLPVFILLTLFSLLTERNTGERVVV
ncbi:ABC transporter permease subunit [Bacillus spongiae]|uniref:ABC transporter permease subunit n=1 Tax=Bacillus spongiae TaxID=2683610 RepID=A0ABU8HBR1_9BACI